MTDQASMRQAPLGLGRPALALLIVCIGTIAAPLDSAVNIAFPSITQAFGRPVQDIRWVVISYVLTYASLLLVFGRIGDLVGYRIVFRIGLVTSTIGFAACALATRFDVLLAGRVMQGLGIALVLSCAPALATTLYPEQERTRILGIYATMTALGAALGPLVGGLLVEKLGWNVVFWARIPLVVVALVLSGVIPARPGGGMTSGLDTLGSLQLVLALCGILLGLSMRGDSVGPMLSLGLVGVGCVSLLAFLRRQSRLAAPIIRPALFRDPLFAAMNVASVIANFAAFSVVLIGPFYLIRIARLDAGVAGLVLGTGALGAMAGSALAARVIARIGGTRATMLAMALSAAGLLGIGASGYSLSMTLLVPALVVQGIGLGLFHVAYADLVTATLPIGERGVAGSLTMVTRTIGIVGGAAGHAGLHRAFEASAAARGAGGDEAFMAGFLAVFIGAALAQILAVGAAIGVGAARAIRRH